MAIIQANFPQAGEVRGLWFFLNWLLEADTKNPLKCNPSKLPSYLFSFLMVAVPVFLMEALTKHFLYKLQP